MPDVLAWDLPIRPIRPSDRLPAPDHRLPAPPTSPVTFIGELHKILAGLLGR